MQNHLSQYRYIIICDEASPSAGGIQNMAYWIARTMARKGFTTVVAGYQPGGNDTYFEGNGIELFKLNSPFRTKHSSDPNLFILLTRLRLRYGRQVVLYAPLINEVKVFRWIRRWLGWHCVSFLHGNETLRLLSRKPNSLKKSLAACVSVFANSRYTKGIAQRLGDFPNLHVVSPGIPAMEYLDFVPTEYRKQKGWQDKKVILIFGRLVKRKGHATVIRAVADLQAKHPDVHLVIVGSGGYRKTIESLIDQAGIRLRTELIDFVSEREKLELYYSCDIFCMPSEIEEEKYDVEGFGIVFLEAAALGKLVIGADSGGISDAVENGESGFLIQTGDAVGLAVLLDQILSDPERFDTIRQHAKKRALTRFDWNTQVDSMLEIIAKAMPLPHTPSVPPERILMIRLSAIGDVIMASGLIPALRQAYPEARIAWLTDEANTDLLRHNPRLDELYLWPRSRWRRLWEERRYRQFLREAGELIRVLRAERFDWVLDLQGLLKSGVWALLAGGKRRIGLGSREGSRWLMTEVLDRRTKDDLIGKEYRKLAAFLGANAFSMDITVSPDDEQSVAELLQTAGVAGKYAVICPFTTRPQKHWLDERWAELSQRLSTERGLPTAMLGGPGDRERAALIAQGTALHNLTGQTTLGQCAALIKNARLLVGVDTGLTHLGIALGTPTLALFGSTRPYLETGSRTAQVLYERLDCSPCRRRPTCGGAYHCMKAHTTEKVFHAATRLLEFAP